MVTSEAFQAEFNAGNFAQALKLALAEAVELKITTTVVQAQENGAALNGITVGDRLYTRLNIVDSELENEIGSGFLSQEPYANLLAFHLSQANHAPHLIHQHLKLLGQLSDAIVALETTPDLGLAELDTVPQTPPPLNAEEELFESIPDASRSEGQATAFIDTVVLLEPIPELDSELSSELSSKLDFTEPQAELLPDDFAELDLLVNQDLLADQPVSEEFILIIDEPGIDQIGVDEIGVDEIGVDEIGVDEAEVLILVDDTESAQDLVADIVSTLHLDTPSLTHENDRQPLEDIPLASPQQDDMLESSILEDSAFEESIDEDLAAILSLDTSDESDQSPLEPDADAELVLADDTESVEELADDLIAALTLDPADTPQETSEEVDLSTLQALDAELADSFESSFEVDLPGVAPEESYSPASLDDPWLTSDLEAIAPSFSEPALSEPSTPDLDRSEPSLSNLGISDLDPSDFDLSEPDLSEPDLSSFDLSEPNLSEPESAESDLFASETAAADIDPFQDIFQPAEPDRSALSDQPFDQLSDPLSDQLSDPADSPPPEPTSDTLADTDLSELLAGAEEPDADSPEELQDALDAWLNLEIGDSTEPTAEELTMPSLQSPVLPDDDPFQPFDQPSNESYAAPTVAPSPFAPTGQDTPDGVNSLDQALSGYEAAAQKTVDELFDEAFGEADSDDSSDDMFVTFFDATADPELDEVNPFGNISLETLNSDTLGDRPTAAQPPDHLTDFTAELESQADSNGTEPDVLDENWPNLPPPPPRSSM